MTSDLFVGWMLYTYTRPLRFECHKPWDCEVRNKTAIYTYMNVVYEDAKAQVKVDTVLLHIILEECHL